MGYPAKHSSFPFPLSAFFPSFRHCLKGMVAIPTLFSPVLTACISTCPVQQGKKPSRLPRSNAQESSPSRSASHIHLPPTPSLPQSGRRTTSVRAQEAIRKNSLHWLVHTRTPYYVPTIVVWSVTPAPKYPQPPQLVIVAMRVLGIVRVNHAGFFQISHLPCLAYLHHPASHALCQVIQIA